MHMLTCTVHVYYMYYMYYSYIYVNPFWLSLTIMRLHVCIHEFIIFSLSRLGSFMGIANSFDQYPREWHQWFTSDSPETTPLPGKYTYMHVGN